MQCVIIQVLLREEQETLQHEIRFLFTQQERNLCAFDFPASPLRSKQPSQIFISHRRSAASND